VEGVARTERKTAKTEADAQITAAALAEQETFDDDSRAAMTAGRHRRRLKLARQNFYDTHPAGSPPAAAAAAAAATPIPDPVAGKNDGGGGGVGGRGLGQQGRKSPAARHAEAMLVAAKQAWRRAETAAAQAKQLQEDLDAASPSDRQQLSFRAAEAADEARAAKAAWQDALAKAATGMEEAKRTMKKL
jgi:hypothetical protein